MDGSQHRSGLARRAPLSRAPTATPGAVWHLTRGHARCHAVPLSVGGDWAAGGRIESAYLSGLALADEIAARPGCHVA